MVRALAAHFRTCTDKVHGAGRRLGLLLLPLETVLNQISFNFRLHRRRVAMGLGDKLEHLKESLTAMTSEERKLHKEQVGD